MQLLVSPTSNESRLEIALTGRLDTAGVDRIEIQFNAAVVAGGREALVDLSGVELITSMGIRMLITAARAMSHRHQRLVLFGAQELVAEVLETAAVDALIATVASRAEALAILGG